LISIDALYEELWSRLQFAVAKAGEVVDLDPCNLAY